MSRFPSQSGGSHNDLTDVDPEDHRTDVSIQNAVDGAAISVDNADNLGGNTPAYYENPAETQENAVSGGWIDESPVTLFTDSRTGSNGGPHTLSGSTSFSRPLGGKTLSDGHRFRIGGEWLSSPNSYSRNFSVSATIKDSEGTELGTISHSGGGSDSTATKEINLPQSYSPDTLTADYSLSFDYYDPDGDMSCRIRLEAVAYHKITTGSHVHPV